MNISVKKILIIVPIVLLIIAAGVFWTPYLYEQYIVYKTEQTYNILKDSYVSTLKTANYKWEDGKMDTAIFANEFVKNLPVKRICEFKGRECFPACINSKSGISFCQFTGFIDEKLYRVELKNNVGIAIQILSPECSNISKICGSVYIDANGKNIGPNLLGRDIFDVSIFKNKIEVPTMKGNMFPNCIYGNGNGCTEYLLEYKNRRYEEYIDYAKEHPEENINTTRYDLQNTIISADK